MKNSLSPKPGKRYGYKTHREKDIRKLELRTDQLVLSLPALEVADIMMRTAELIYEIRFVLRLHQWPDSSWQHERLTEMIEHIDEQGRHALAERNRVPEPEPVETPPPGPEKDAFYYALKGLAVASGVFFLSWATVGAIITSTQQDPGPGMGIDFEKRELEIRENHRRAQQIAEQG